MGALLGFVPFVLVALACPLMMMLMMRGMHGGGTKHEAHNSCHEQNPQPATEARIQALEQELAALRSAETERARASVSARAKVPVGSTPSTLRGEGTDGLSVNGQG